MKAHVSGDLKIVCRAEIKIKIAAFDLFLKITRLSNYRENYGRQTTLKRSFRS